MAHLYSELMAQVSMRRSLSTTHIEGAPVLVATLVTKRDAELVKGDGAVRIRSFLSSPFTCGSRDGEPESADS